MQKEKSVRTYQRKSKNGKVVTVRSYKAKYDAAEEARKEMAKRAGAGDELKKKKSAAPADLGFTADEFKIWANDLDVEEAKRIDKILVKKYGEKAVQKLADEINAGNSRTYKAVFARLSSEKPKESKKDRVVDDFLSGKDVSKQLTEKKSSRKTTKVGKGEYQTGMKVANKKLSAKEQKLVDKILDENKGKLDKEYLEAFYPEVSKKVHEAVMKAQSAKSPKEKSVKKATTKTTKSAKTEKTAVKGDVSGREYFDGKKWLNLKSTPKSKELRDLVVANAKKKGIILNYGDSTETGKKPKSMPTKTKSSDVMSKSAKETSSKKQVLHGEAKNMGASAIKYNNKTYMVTTDGKVETITGRRVGKALSDKILDIKASGSSKSNRGLPASEMRARQQAKLQAKIDERKGKFIVSSSGKPLKNAVNAAIAKANREAYIEKSPYKDVLKRYSGDALVVALQRRGVEYKKAVSISNRLQALKAQQRSVEFRGK